MRRYGNVLGLLLAALGALLGAALLVRMAWDWSIPGVFGIGPIAFKHVLGLLLLSAVSAGLFRLGRHRDGWRLFTGRW